MKVTPVFVTCTLRIVNDGVFIFTCNVKYDEYNCWKNHAFVYDIHFKHLHQSKFCGALVDNRVDAPICFLEDKGRDTKKKLILALIELFGGM